MTADLPQISDLIHPPRRGRKRWKLLAAAGAGGLILAGAALAFLHFAAGELPADWVRGQLAARLAASIGDGARIDLQSATIERQDGETQLVIRNFSAYDAEGRPIVGAPQAIVTFNPYAAALGRFAPRKIDLVGLDLNVRLSEDGSLAFSTRPEEAVVKPQTNGAVQAPSESPGVPAAGQAGSWQERLIDFIESLAADDGRLLGMEKFGLKRGRIHLQDQKRGRDWLMTDVAIDIDRNTAGEKRVILSGKGAKGAWRVDARFAKIEGVERRVQVEFGGFSLTDFADALQIVHPFDDRGIVSGQLKLETKGKTDFAALAGNIFVTDLRPKIAARGEFRIAPATMEAAFTYVPERGDVEISALRWASGGSKVTMAARLAFAEAGAMRLDITALSGQLAPAAAHLEALDIAEGTGAITLADGVLRIAPTSLRGPQFAVRLEGRWENGDAGRAVLNIEAQECSASAVFGFWPGFFAPDLRAYLLSRSRGGKVEAFQLQIDAATREVQLSLEKNEPLPAHVQRVTYKIAGGQFSPLEGLPPIDLEEVFGTSTSQQTVLTAASASIRTKSGQRMALRDVRIDIAQAQKPGALPRLDAVFRLNGAASGLADLLETPFLANLLGRDIPTHMSKGRIDLRLNVSSPLGQEIRPQEIALESAGTLSDVTLEKALAGEAIQGANLALKIDRSLIALKGDATIYGAPATLDLRKPMRGTGGDITITARIDEAMRAKRGLLSGQALSGPVGLTMKVPLGAKDFRPRIELDLSRAATTGLVPGFAKPAGRPAKAAFTLVPKAGGYDLVDFSAEALSLSLFGQVSLDANYALRTARFEKARLSPGDVGRVDIERVGNGWKAVVRANIIDARPYLGQVFAQPSGAKGEAHASPSLDLELKSEIVTGHHAEALSGVDLKFVRSEGIIRSFRLTGRIGAASVSGNLARRNDGATVVVLQSANAGAALRFVDLYRRMVGGSLIAQTTVAGDKQDGELVIRNFQLRDEPALRRVLADPAMVNAGGSTPDRPPPQLPRDGTVSFDRLRADFSRTNGVLELGEAVMWGPVLGANIEGRIDFNRSNINVTGTFVPAYALNNMFARVPVLGFFLGGGEHGGLFAVNFKVSGPLSGPTLSINPLSAIAPGFLRKFFEFSRATQADAPPPRLIEHGGAR